MSARSSHLADGTQRSAPERLDTVPFVHRQTTVTIPVAALVLALTTSLAGFPRSPHAARTDPTVWFLTNDARVGRLSSTATRPIIYNNPLGCQIHVDDCNLRGIAEAHQALWLSDANNGLRGFNPKTGRSANSKNDNRYSSPPVAWDGRLWFTDIDRLLRVDPPNTRVASVIRVANAYVEALAPSAHYLWVAGSGSTSGAHAAVVRINRAGRILERFDLGMAGEEVQPVLGALDDRTAYVVLSPQSASGETPSRLLQLTAKSSGARVRDLGALSFGSGGIVASGHHLWLTDVNTSRLVELALDGSPLGQVSLTVPGNGRLIGAFQYLWYVGSARKGESVLEIVDPNTARVLRTLSISLPANDSIGAFTVTQNLG